MSSTPHTNLQATPDFSNFQFRTKAADGFVDRQVRFSGQTGEQIYKVEFRNQGGVMDDPSWPQSGEYLDVIMTLVLIIEIYSERYPKRILRLSPDNQMEGLLFGNLMGRYLLETLFTIEPECEKMEGFGPDSACPFLLIRRKPFPYISAHTLETNWRGVSRIFDAKFKIELDKKVRLGLMSPNE